MKIKKIESFPVKLKLKEPFVIANVVNDDMFYVIVKLTTDTGIVGYGEAIPAWEVTGETQFGVIDVINHFCEPKKTGMTLIGADISTFDKVKGVLDKISPNTGINAVWGAPSAKAAIEEAILDAYGKHVNKPIYEIFGGKNKKIPFNRAISIYPVEETLEKVKEELEKGTRKIKLKIGVIKVGELDNYERDVQVIRRARAMIDKVDPSIELIADANQGYITPEQTIKVLKKVDGCLNRIEQPILADDKLGLKKVKNACNVKVIADEAVHGYHDAKLLLELGAVDYLNLKLMKTGGLLEALRIADLAKKYNVQCQAGSMLENKIGSAIAANLYLISNNVFMTELDSFRRLKKCIGSGIEAYDDHIILSDKPGIGIEVDESEIMQNLITAQDSLTLKQIKKVL